MYALQHFVKSTHEYIGSLRLAPVKSKGIIPVMLHGARLSISHAAKFVMRHKMLRRQSGAAVSKQPPGLKSNFYFAFKTV